MTVADVFVIRGRGAVATGRVESGEVRTGDALRINDDRVVTVDAIEAFRKKLSSAGEGENVGLLFRSLEREDIKAGDVLTGDGGGQRSGGDDLGEAARRMGLG